MTGRRPIFPYVRDFAGDPGWIRTIDLPLRRRPLYPLSYEAPIMAFLGLVAQIRRLGNWKKRGSEFWPTTPPCFPCVRVESLLDAGDLTGTCVPLAVT